ncbi:MAG TPA: type II toxin-antitoxin system RelE/ParE family toxin [Gammaproteobacteria bacterium]|nr:type II toxin-antitoxin system RelE/ParE family toxin [Gammaproteobacteria bacterium]
MANYEIRFKKSVAKDLRAIPKRDVRKILERIDALAVNPRSEGCIKLSGQDRYRIRQGVYRIIYEIKDADIVVVVVKVGHRSRVYKGN